jgi:hypothetical protein
MDHPEPLSVAKGRLDVGKEQVADRHWLGWEEVGVVGRELSRVYLRLIDEGVGEVNDVGVKGADLSSGEKA